MNKETRKSHRLIMMTDLGGAICDIASSRKGDQTDPKIMFEDQEFDVQQLADIYYHIGECDLRITKSMGRGRGKQHFDSELPMPHVYEHKLIDILADEFQMGSGAKEQIEEYIKWGLLVSPGILLKDGTHKVYLNEYLTVSAELHEDTTFTEEEGTELYINGMRYTTDNESLMVYCVWDPNAEMLKAKYFDNDKGPLTYDHIRITIDG